MLVAPATSAPWLRPPSIHAAFSGPLAAPDRLRSRPRRRPPPLATPQRLAIVCITRALPPAGEPEPPREPARRGRPRKKRSEDGESPVSPTPTPAPTPQPLEDDYRSEFFERGDRRKGEVNWIRPQRTGEINWTKPPNWTFVEPQERKRGGRPRGRVKLLPVAPRPLELGPATRTPMKDCPDCGGRGEHVCALCHGSGIWPFKMSAWILPNPPCARCRGRGEHRCRTCFPQEAVWRPPALELVEQQEQEAEREALEVDAIVAEARSILQADEEAAGADAGAEAGAGAGEAGKGGLERVPGGFGEPGG
eukprot:tig00001030_g6478.t1